MGSTLDLDMGAWSPDFTNRRLAIGSGGKKWIKHVIISHFQKIMTDFGSRLVPELHLRAEGARGVLRLATN